MGWLVPVLVLCLLAAMAEGQVHGANQYWPSGYYYGANNMVGRPAYGAYHGGGRPGYYQPSYPPYKTQVKSTTVHKTSTPIVTPADPLDFMFSRAENVQDQLKTCKEQLKTLTADMNHQLQALADLNQNTLPALQATDDRQTEALNQMKDELAGVEDDVTNDLDPRVDELTQKNSAVSADQRTAEGLVADLRAKDVTQQGHIAELHSKIQGLLNPLTMEVVNSGFPMAEREAGVVGSQLTALQTADRRSVCENGQLTLDDDDRKAEFQFQRPFSTMPRVLYSICGFNYDLDSLQDSTTTAAEDKGTAHGHLEGHQGYKHPVPKDPEAIGVRVSALATTTGATFELFDLSFGEPKCRSVDVCFRACT